MEHTCEHHHHIITNNHNFNNGYRESATSSAINMNLTRDTPLPPRALQISSNPARSGPNPHRRRSFSPLQRLWNSLRRTNGPLVHDPPSSPTV